MTEWMVEESVRCVVCPGCAFTFDAGHVDTTGPHKDGYSCPACAENRLRERVLHWLRKYRGQLRWNRTEAELLRSGYGYDWLGDIDKRIQKLYMQFNAESRGDSHDLDGDEVTAEQKWNNVIGALATCLVRAVGNARWAVNEHRRAEALEADVKALLAVVRYTASPTMGRPGTVDPQKFAEEGASDSAVRSALSTCIFMAETVLVAYNARHRDD